MGNRRGMTLLEVLIALAILAISFVLLIRTHVQSYTMIAGSETLNRAALLEESLCARLEAFGWKDVSARRGFEEGPPRLFYKTDIGDSPFPGLKKLVIRIYLDRDKKALTKLTRWMSFR